MKEHLVLSISSFKHVDEAMKYKGKVKYAFIVFGNISNIAMIVKQLSKANIKSFIHIDHIEGLSNEDYTYKFLKNNVKAYGIITTRGQSIQKAHAEGLKVVQRSFIIDNRSIKQMIESIKRNTPDFLEIMPSITSYLIPCIQKEIDIEIITGGLMDTLDIYNQALNNGASMVSTTNMDMWHHIITKD